VIALDKKERVPYLFEYGNFLLTTHAQGIDVTKPLQKLIGELEKVLIDDYREIEPLGETPFTVRPDLQFFKE
jgi:hypothetical protein